MNNEFQYTPFIVITLYWVVCVQLAHISLGNWKDVSIAHVSIIIKSDDYPFLSYFSCLCAWDCCYFIFCIRCIYIPFWETGILFSLLLRSLWWLQIVGYILACRLYSFVCTLHHLIIIIGQTYLKTLNLWNTCQIYLIECVSKITHILPVIHYRMYGAVFSVYPFPLWWLRKYILSYYHHQIGSMNYHPLFRVRSWNNGMRCMSLYILIEYRMNVKYIFFFFVKTRPCPVSGRRYWGLILLTRVNHYRNCEKYPPSPRKLRCLELIEQYLPNISGPVYSMHRSFMWFMCLRWHRSAFYRVIASDVFSRVFYGRFLITLALGSGI